MNLMDLRTEVEGHGFDPIQYGARINQYLNDGQNLIARRVDYYVDDANQRFSTAAGTTNYPFPANFGRGRDLFNTQTSQTLRAVGLREIDNSIPIQGMPLYYAAEGVTLRLFPTPDAAYPLEFRYWAMPPPLVNDTDEPSLPADYHNILWVYAVWMCYEADDDTQQGQYWQQRFNGDLAQFTADQKFPVDTPTAVRGMWDQHPSLNQGAWQYYVG